MVESVIGYDITKYIGMPGGPKFQAHRIRHGRYVDKSPMFATHAEALSWIMGQKELDRDDKDKARIPPPRKEDR